MLQNVAKSTKLLAKFQKFQPYYLVDFEKCCKTRIFLQKSVPIQPKTSKILPKFCQKLATTLRVRSSRRSPALGWSRRGLRRRAGGRRPASKAPLSARGVRGLRLAKLAKLIGKFYKILQNFANFATFLKKMQNFASQLDRTLQDLRRSNFPER